MIQRLALPEGIVGRVLHHPQCPGKLIEPMCPCKGAGRSSLPEGLIIVVGPTLHGVPFILLSCLAGGVVEVGLPESAVMKPVVTHPAIYHGALGRGHFERRVRSK